MSSMKQDVFSPELSRPRSTTRLPFQSIVLGLLLLLAACGGSNGGDPSGADTVGTAKSAPADTMAVGLKDEDYSAPVAEITGARASTFELVAGELPPGLELDGKSGVIAGRAARTGEYAFTVRIQSAGTDDVLRNLKIVIDESAGSSSAPGSEPGVARKSLAQSGAPDISNLLGIVAGMGEGDWRRVNLNAFSSVWTPSDLRTIYNSGATAPSKIILAWSSFVWDSNRASLLLYGGGHANYRGNDVYAWRASSQMWERASLPSEMVQNALGHWNAIDGVAKAPASAHTYDNSIFLPILDRMLVLGGAADSNGGHYLTQGANGAARNTGPYLFDPSRADPDKVGGSTGSHVQRVKPYPEILGGEMWSNRESWLNASALSAPPVESLTNSCTGYAEESGRDVVYLRTAYRIYRYEIQNLADPTADRWKLVGRYWSAGSGNQGTCGYDPDRKILVSTHKATPLIYWDLKNPSTVANDTMVTPTDPTGEFPQLISSGAISLANCGFEFDPLRKDFKLWCGDGRIWTVTPPATLGAAGWTVVKAASPAGAVPSEGVGTGILGKWKYIPNLDVFMGLADATQGNIWIYKPHGWSNPAGSVNLPPSVSLTAPTADASFTAGTPIALSANASDGDGSVRKVEFFANGGKIGEASGAPYTMVWSNAAVGTYAMTAVATDNAGATKTSVSVSIRVNPVVVPNVPPSVSLVRPADGSSVTAGTAVTLEATASDSDGSIARVEFYAGGSKLGEATAAPFSWIWLSPPQGTHVVTAVAIDNKGASTTSSPVSLAVTPANPGGQTSVVLQRGQSGSVVVDTYISSYHKTLNFGANTQMMERDTYYAPLMRFAIFRSEGGPVPNGARIVSATLSVYKYSSYNMVYGLSRILSDWSEQTATWNVRMTGVPWATPGAGALGQDVAPSTDATGTTDFNPGWINFDLTASIQQMSLASPLVNYGWRIMALSGYQIAEKKIYASEFAGDTTLRPKLRIVYE